MDSNRVFRVVHLIRSAFGQYKRQIIAMAVLSFFSGIFEGIGINAIVPLFSVIQGGSPADVISRSIQKFFLYFDIRYTVKYLLIFIIILFIVKAILYFYTQYITAKITADYERTTRAELLQTTLAADWPYLLKQRLGHLDQILTTDVDRSSALLFHVGGMLLIVANLAVYTVIALNISFVVAMLAIAVGGMIFLGFKSLFFKTRAISRENANERKELAHFINENVIGMKTVKAFFAEDAIYRRGVGYFDHLRDLLMRLSLIKNFITAAVQPIGLLFLIGIFAFFYKTRALDFASFAVIVYAINKVFSNIQLVQAEAHVLNVHAPHLASVLRYREEAIGRREKSVAEDVFRFDRALEFKNAQFSYVPDREALFDVSFVIKKGEMVGLIGPSGAGKTTVVDLLLRLLAPQKGAITLDGNDISRIRLADWRTRVAYVSQDVFLLNDTIGNNIRFYGDSIRDEDIEAAAKMANIYEFIQSLPQKFETMVGERGIELSGGQRQRIVLARALARKPDILILDEATSALDNESEALIQRSIEALRGKITVVVIAHRLSTVMIADTLVVLDNGKIIEAGAPTELLKNKNSYFFKSYNVHA